MRATITKFFARSVRRNGGSSGEFLSEDAAKVMMMLTMLTMVFFKNDKQ